MSDYRSVKVNSKFFDRVYEITHESTMRAIENATTKSSNYSYLSNKRGGWNKRGGRDFFEKLVHKSNKRGVEGGQI